MNDASHYYRAIFNDLDLMAWAVDMEGTIQVMEGKGLRLGGTTPGELLDLARDAIIVRRFDGRVVSWNKGAERLYGYMSGDAVGRTSHALLQTRFPEEIAQIERELLANGCWEGELVHTRRDGMAAVVSSRWVLKRDPNGAALDSPT